MAKYNTQISQSKRKNVEDYEKTEVKILDGKIIIASAKLSPPKKYILTRGANEKFIHIQEEVLNSSNVSKKHTMRHPTENLPNLIKRVIESVENAANWTDCINVEKISNPNQYES